MRRVAAIALVLVAAGGITVFGSGFGFGAPKTYQVRATFDNAESVIEGEDVKVAGVKVGKISQLDVTEDEKAVVVMNITEPGFQAFKQDAHCVIRPQSLIGEKFVECTLTNPRPVGTKAPPSLGIIKSGQGKGDYFLPVENTSSPVDLDLINNVLRRPYAERLSLIINELGTGLAGNGQNLRDTIQRAAPALGQLDRVLKILANNNQVLADLARNGDRAVAPLARDRKSVSGFITHAGNVAEATAARRQQLEGTIRRLPRFLTELRPTMQRLGLLSDEVTPVLQDLRVRAPAINRLIRNLGPFAQGARPALSSLSHASDVGIPAIRSAQPIVRQLRQLAAATKPTAKDASDILTSFRDTGGIEALMNYAFYQTTAVNGFDAVGHYLRALLIVNTCSVYATKPVNGCSSNFAKDPSSANGGRAAANPRLRRPDGRGDLADVSSVLNGADPAKVQELQRKRSGKKGAMAMPGIGLPGKLSQKAAPAPKPDPAAAGASQAPSPSGGPDSQASAGLFDYLLGG